ncbi:MAG TPA: hypothetical protein VEA79_14620, partial [Phenylobacterium sp.]|nr:hypothetical protein [Phenylobacterium sp.]
MTPRRIGLAALAAGLCLAASPAADAAPAEVADAQARLRQLLELDRRAAEVGDRLLAAGADLCASPGHLLTGAILHRPADYGPRLRPAFAGAPDTPSVAVIVTGSPAA